MTRQPPGDASQPRQLADAEQNGPDLRFAPTAIATWLAALWALYLSPAGGVAVAALAAGVALACWYAQRRVQHGRGALLATVALGLMLGAISGAACTAARTAVRDAEPVAGWATGHAAVRADIVVTDDPARVRGRRVRSWLVDARLTAVRRADGSGRRIRVDVGVLVIGNHVAWHDVLPGQQAAVTGQLSPPRGGDLRAAVLSVTGAPQLRGAPPAVQSAAGSLRHGLQRAAEPLPDEPGGLLPGLAVGDVSRMDPSVEADFRTTGMTHLTAVSGSNVAIIVGLMLLIAAWCRAGPRTAVAVSLVALVGFVILVRPSPSVLRAATMGALALVALASSRPRAAVPGLAVTVYVLILYNPELAGDLGFALSVLATAGLLLLAPRWRDALRRRGVPTGLAEAIAVPVAAQTACAPVIAAMTGTVSLSAIPANLASAPAVAPATVLGAAAAAVSPLWSGGAEFLAWLGGWPARWLVLVAHWGAGLPGGTAPWPGGTAGGLLLAAVLTLVLVLTRRRAARRLIAAVAAAAVIGAAGARTVTTSWPPPGWTFVACDVGQGDALVIRTGTGQAVVVDAGPEATSVDRCLHRLDIVAVPLLLVSHYHADHIGGLAGVLRRREVAAVVGPVFPEPESGRAAVEKTSRGAGVAVLHVNPGWRYNVGEMGIEVLGPERTEAGTRSDPNNNSLILRVTLAGMSLLLAGDAEVERQQALLATGIPLQADILKVAHHGSAYQDSGFLDAVDPAVAIVSVGADNEYGHPNRSLVRRLTVDGARVFRTDQGGDIAVSRTDRGLAVTNRGRDAGEGPA